MRYILLFFTFSMCLSLYAQDSYKIHVTADNRFQFEIPHNWELMKEENGRVTIVYVGDVDVTPYTVISLGFTDRAPTFEDDVDAVTFVLGRDSDVKSFEKQQVGDYTTLIREIDRDEVDTLFAIILLDDGIVGVIEVNELEFTADLNVLRPIVDSIIMSMEHKAPEQFALNELEAITPDISNLTSVYTSESGLFQLKYPEDWVVQAIQSDLILITSSDFVSNSLPDLGLQVFVLEIPDWVNPSTDFLPEVLNLMMEDFETSNSINLRHVNLAGRKVAVAYDELNPDTVIMLAIQVDDAHFAVLTGIRANYGYEEAEQMVMAVASTIEISQPNLEVVEVDTSELTEEATVLEGLVTFKYPKNWILDTDNLISVYLPKDLDSPDPENHEITLVINVFPKTVEEGIALNSSLLDVAETIQQSRRGVSSPATEFMLGELPAVLMNMGMPDVEGWLLYLEYDRGIVAQVMILPYEGNLKPYRDVVYAIASTIEIK